MQNIPTKITGDSLTAAEFNQIPDELENIITGTGQSLSGADLNQVGKSLAVYAAGGQAYTDSGAANAYVLSVIGSKQAPTAYFVGQVIRFVPGNNNTTASTVNVATLGVKSVVDKHGAALLGGELLTTREAVAWYDGTSFRLIESALEFIHRHGLVISNNGGAPTTTVDISAGAIEDSTYKYILRLASTFSKTTGAWAAGSGNGGLFSGTVAVSTWYHIFLIRKTSDGSIDAGFDTSLTAANIPAGYVAYKRIGSVLTDGSANILAFLAVERPDSSLYYLWDAPILNSSGALSTTTVTVTVSTPPGISSMAEISALCGIGGGKGTLYMKHPSITNYGFQVVDAENTFNGAARVFQLTNTVPQVDIKMNGAGTHNIYTNGFIDFRR